MKIKSIDQIMKNLKRKPKEIEQKGIIYGDEFECWLKEQKDSNVYHLDTKMTINFKGYKIDTSNNQKNKDLISSSISLSTNFNVSKIFNNVASNLTDKKEFICTNDKMMYALEA